LPPAPIDFSVDILLYDNSVHATAEVAHQLARGRNVDELLAIRGITIVRQRISNDWTEIDSTRIEWPDNLGFGDR
jgi:hypothetical protein